MRKQTAFNWSDAGPAEFCGWHERRGNTAPRQMTASGVQSVKDIIVSDAGQNPAYRLSLIRRKPAGMFFHACRICLYM